MEKTFTFFLLTLLLLLHYVMAQINITTDKLALLSLKSQIISDPFHFLNGGWSPAISVCRWVGVTCDSRHQRVKSLNLSNMALTGRIPRDFGNVTFLASLDLGSNNFQGNLPREMAHLRRLKFLNLSFNSFSGEIPSWFGFLHQLQFQSLMNNSFTGSLTSSCFNISKLETLDLKFNSLDGQIPKEIGSAENLRYLSLYGNNLIGSIPPSISNASRLDKLDLAGNLLQGNVPEGIGKLHNLNWLSIKDNQLTGIIPLEIGNLVNLVYLGMGENQITGSIPISIFNISSLQYVSLWRNNLKGALPREIGNLTKMQVLYLDENRFTVKVFNLQVEAAFKSFDTECEVLRSLHHRNLLKVITSCSNLDFKALVLEYMPNGSLEKWLYSHNHFLDVRQRISIMIDVAYAMEYLHHGCSLPVIHCDLTPSNILLDEDMVAHLSDFGISKLLGEDDCDLYTKTLATLGYIAPEYGLDGLVSVKCDVYSYGIMLLETFTRRKPSEFEGDLSLKQWVSYSLPEAVMDVVDANLITLTDNSSQKKLDVVASILKVALDCCAESPAKRTNMKDVVGMLQKIQIQLLAC